MRLRISACGMAAILAVMGLAGCSGMQNEGAGIGPAAESRGAANPGINTKRYTYVIVHGAWAGGFEWKKVGDQLLADGHYVERVTLTGMGERSHLTNPDIDLNTHITDVVNTILFDNLHDVVLMGHSYGGMVITGVADRVPDRIKCVVYVDAFLPENGESLNSLASSGRGGPSLTVVNGYVGSSPRPGAQPPYNVPQPAKTLSQPVSLQHQDQVAKIPTVYILTVDRGARPESDTFYKFYQRAQARGWFAEIMEGPHTVNVSAPTETARRLEAAPEQALPTKKWDH
jgi:pimeloyl-ACP methyl ester carboxylesterase